MYGMSKLALSMYTRALSTAPELQEKRIMVNACCPGWCSTDMSSNSGPKSALQGADTPVWLALRSPKEFVTGSMFTDRQQVPW
jgi:carbonyl reductase 1